MWARILSKPPGVAYALRPSYDIAAMKRMPESEFAEKCIALIAEVAAGGDEVLVTREGTVVAKLVRFDPTTDLLTLEQLRGSVEILGDIVAPIDEEWDAEP
jgi:antitoxin (DNA-binding transcriptional repressor) of toxin-antitoxin stability system